MDQNFGKPNKKETPINETENTVSYLGVKLEKARKSENAPSKKQYEDYINDKFSLDLQRKMAVSFLQGDPILVEGGTSIGKTTAAKKMASDLGWEVHYANLNGATDVEDLMGRYIPNPHKKSPEDPEYIFVDGKVTSALRVEDGKTKMLILDEINSASPNILIRLHEVLDALERDGDVTLSEDASEVVPVSKGSTKVVGLANPPGKGYLQREPLDPAQLRRWVYQKEETTLPKESFAFATESLFGLQKPGQEFGNKVLESRESILSAQELMEIPGIDVIVKKYEEFHDAAKQLVEKRKIGNDQPQKFMFDDREEPRRVRDFMMHFYRGDVNGTFQEALRYYYAGKVLDKKDKMQLDELIKFVMVKEAQNEKRIPVPDNQTQTATPDAKKPKPKMEGIASLLIEAKEIMGDNFYGPEEIENTFDIEVEDVPAIPFTKEDLEQAKDLGQELILYIEAGRDGKPLTAKKMKELLKNKTSKDTTLINSDWFETDSVVSKESPRFGWRLSAKEAFKESANKNYFDQTEAIVKYLENEIFKDGAPSPYQEAIHEFLAIKEIGSLEKYSKSDDEKKWKPAAEKLANLKINQMCRENYSEVLYRMALHEKKMGERLLDSAGRSIYYTWTNSRDSGGGLVCVGGFGSGGSGVDGWSPRRSRSSVGVCFSRGE